MELKLYQHIAKNLNWQPNENFVDQREDNLDKLEGLLPSGSGIDCGSRIDRESYSETEFSIDADYHYMDDNGFYAGWFTFRITVTANLAWNYNVECEITSNDTDEDWEYIEDLYNQYLVEVYINALNEKVELEKVKG